MTKACLALAFFVLGLLQPVRAFDWETTTSSGRDYVTLKSFCAFYSFYYEVPGGDYFTSRSSTGHSIRFKLGNSDINLDGVHYVLSFPIQGGDHDWLVSRMDIIKLFEPILRPTEIDGRHTIRGVVIDPGHGGTDNGAASSLGYEKRYTLDTANRLEAILRAAGLKTVLTRRTDVFVDLYERAHIASLYPDYAFVSIHYNSAEAEAHGLETYCLAPRGAASTSSYYLSRADLYKLPGNDYDTQNILLASMVHSEIIGMNPGDPSADRGVKRARFVVIKQNVLPAILVEGGFLSNHIEARRVDRDDYRQRLAQAIARGVIRFANSMGDRNMPLPEEAAPPPRATPVAPPAPSGLASQSTGGPVPKAPVAKPTALASGTSSSPSVMTSTAIMTTSNSAAPGHKKKKKTHGASAPATTPINLNAPATNAPPAAPAPAAPPAAPPTPAPAPVAPPSSTNSSPAAGTPTGPLNLNEPTAPAPSSVPEKPAGNNAEPDEPPTVPAPPATSSSNAPAATSASPSQTSHTNSAPPTDPPTPAIAPKSTPPSAPAGQP
jgi:N-acetylmuramoyl-L-alanine amidase